MHIPERIIEQIFDLCDKMRYELDGHISVDRHIGEVYLWDPGWIRSYNIVEKHENIPYLMSMLRSAGTNLGPEIHALNNKILAHMREEDERRSYLLVLKAAYLDAFVYNQASLRYIFEVVYPDGIYDDDDPLAEIEELVVEKFNEYCEIKLTPYKIVKNMPNNTYYHIMEKALDYDFKPYIDYMLETYKDEWEKIEDKIYAYADEEKTIHELIEEVEKEKDKPKEIITEEDLPF